MRVNPHLQASTLACIQPCIHCVNYDFSMLPCEQTTGQNHPAHPYKKDQSGFTRSNQDTLLLLSSLSLLETSGRALHT